jgi:hypothetical protein
MRQAKKRATRDFRGSTYDRITGRVVLTCLMLLLACGSTPDNGLFESTLSDQSVGGQSHSSDISGGTGLSGTGSLPRLDTSTGGILTDCLSGAKPAPHGQPWSPNCVSDSDCVELCKSRIPICLGWCECIGSESQRCNPDYPHLTNKCYVGCPMHSECRDGQDCVPPGQ